MKKNLQYKYKMSSAFRSLGVKKEALTRFIKADSLCYEPDVDPISLFPFTYNSGVLDITYEGNDFKAVMVDISGVDPYNGESNLAVRIMGGPYLVTSLGSKFKAYIRSWRAATIDAGSPIEVDVPAQVLKIQGAVQDLVNSTQDDNWRISTQRPESDNYITGNALDGFKTTYVFKTPLTFTIKESGVTQYIVFRTMFDQE